MAGKEGAGEQDNHQWGERILGASSLGVSPTYPAGVGKSSLKYNNMPKDNFSFEKRRKEMEKKAKKEEKKKRKLEGGVVEDVKEPEALSSDASAVS